MSTPLVASPMLVVGLGGTGRRVAALLRSHLRERRVDGSSVGLLVIDSAPRESVPDGTLFMGSEYVCTDLPGEESVVEAAASLGVDAPAHADPDLTRPLGRLGLLRNYRQEFEPRLRRALAGLLSKTSPDSALRVFVVASTGSTSGGALLLDVAQAVRVHTRERPAWIEALLLLPSVYADGMRDRFLKLEAYKSNTYATLMELDYFMGPESEPYRLELPDAEPLEVLESPLDRCHLLGMADESLRRLPSTESMFAMVTEKLMAEALAPMDAWEMMREDEGQRWLALPPIRGRHRNFSSFGVTSLVCSRETLEEWCSLRLVGELIDCFFLGMHHEQDEVGHHAQGFLWNDNLDEPRLRNEFQRTMNWCLERHRMSDFSEQDFELAPLRFAEICQQLEAMEVEQHLAAVRADLDERYERWGQETLQRIEAETVSNLRLQGVIYSLRWLQELLSRLADLGCRLEDEVEPLREAARRFVRRMQRCKDLADDTTRNVFVLGRKERLLAISREYVREIRSHYQNALELAVHEQAVHMLGRLRDHIEHSVGRHQMLRLLLEACQDEVGQAFERLFVKLESRQRGGAAEIDVQEATRLQTWYESQRPDDYHELVAQLLGSGETPFRWENLEPEAIVYRILRPVARRFFAGSGDVEDILQLLREAPPPTCEAEETDEPVHAGSAGGEATDAARAWLSLAAHTCRPYWLYHQAQLEDQPVPFERTVVCIAEPCDPRLEGFLDAHPALSVLPSGDPTVIRVMVEAHGLPLFALAELQDCRLDYEKAMREKVRPLHLSRFWIHLPEPVSPR